MKLADRLSRFFTSLAIVLLFALSLAPDQRVQARNSAPQTNPPASKYYLPLIGKDEPPTWLGPDGGSAIFIAADPYNSAVFYAGSSGGGIYKSTDGGVNWQPASQGLGNLTIYCLAIDPSNTGTIYAGTYGDGVYKTTTGGASWFPVTAGFNLPAVVYSLAVNPGNTSLVYASTRLRDSLDGILYKSSNGGASWEAVFGQSNDWVYSLAVDPNSPNIVLAATHEHGPYIANSYGGYGDWEPANINSGEWFKGRAVAFDPRDNSRAYFSAWHGDFYRSSNSGQSWSEYSNGLGSSHVYPNGIVVKPSSPDTLYMAAHSSDVAGVLKSTNSGASWFGAGLYGGTIYTVAAAAYGDTVLAGTYLDGIYRSTNGGASWAHSMSGFSNSQVSGVAIYGTRMIAGTLGSGLQQSLDGGHSWAPFNGGLDDQYINGLVQKPGAPNILFALASNAGLYRIDLNLGSGWQPASPSLAAPALAAPDQVQSRQTSPLVRREALDEYLELEGESAAENQVAPVAQAVTTAAVGGIPLSLTFAPSNPAYAYLGTNQGLYASTDGGATWTMRLSGLEVRTVAVSPSDPQRVYAGTSQVGFVKTSADAGVTWTDISVWGHIVYSLTVTPGITAGGPERIYIGTEYGLLRFEGALAEWINGINTKINVLSTNPARPGIVYIGTDQGAYVIGNAYNFRPVATGFGVQAFSFDPADPAHIYAGTTGRGTMRFRMN